MAKVFAQHATAGEYHLDTWFIKGKWAWKAVAIKHTLPEFSGTADSLEGAIKSAKSSIGLSTPLAWANVGLAIEVPDSMPPLGNR